MTEKRSDVQMLAELLASKPASAHEPAPDGINPATGRYDVKFDSKVINRPAFIADSNKISRDEYESKVLESLHTPPVFDANGDRYNDLPDAMQTMLMRAAIAKATGNPNADDVMAGIRSANALAEAANLPELSTPANEQEYEQRILNARDRARALGYEIYSVPGATLPIALGVNGTWIHKPALQIGRNPSDVAARGRLMEIESWLTLEERHAMSEKQIGDARDVQNTQAAADYAEAQRLSALRQNAPTIIEAMQAQIAELQVKLAERDAS
jgi:hypothetical protein